VPSDRVTSNTLARHDLNFSDRLYWTCAVPVKQVFMVKMFAKVSLENVEPWLSEPEKGGQPGLKIYCGP
jgi:hypothetical protein